MGNWRVGPAYFLGDEWFLPLSPGCRKFFSHVSSGNILFPLPQIQGPIFMSLFPQMMIMLGAICAIIVVVIVSKYR